MRRRPKINLDDYPKEESEARGDEARLERKRKRWAVVNKHRPAEENPFLSAIKPDHDNYGDPNETTEELRARLAGLEFGNYPGYFNYRNKATSAKSADGNQQTPNCPLKDGLIDERLRLMKEDWFKDKKVLDVGCNRGHITYALAKTYSPRFILGIDIDLKMIHMANRDLHLHLEEDILRRNLEYRVKRAHKLSESSADSSIQAADGDAGCRKQYIEDEKEHFTLSSYIAQGPLATHILKTVKNDCDKVTTGEAQQEGSGRADRSEESTDTSQFPNNLLFVEHNYVLANDELVDRQKAHFDTIVCLSVTKWIHLNYRDAGLKRFFKRMYNHLNDGGLLILEVQPFDNYHRRKKLSERLRSNFNSIKFTPDQFDEFLLSEQVGFKQIVFSTTTEHECAGFKRPMKVFLK